MVLNGDKDVLAQQKEREKYFNDLLKKADSKRPKFKYEPKDKVERLTIEDSSVFTWMSPKRQTRVDVMKRRVRKVDTLQRDTLPIDS